MHHPYQGGARPCQGRTNIYTFHFARIADFPVQLRLRLLQVLVLNVGEKFVSSHWIPSRVGGGWRVLMIQ